MTRTLPLLALLLLAGCAGDPDLGSTSEAVLRSVPVERAAWESASPGCEGVSGEVRRCAGEPLLGVLVGPSGGVLCVDALTLLDQEARPRVLRDPTPTPLVPEDDLEADWL